MITEEERKQAALTEAKVASPFWDRVPASNSVHLVVSACLGQLGCELGRTVIFRREKWGLFSLIGPDKKVRFVTPEEDEIRKACVESGDCGPCPFNPEKTS